MKKILSGLIKGKIQYLTDIRVSFIKRDLKIKKYITLFQKSFYKNCNKLNKEECYIFYNNCKCFHKEFRVVSVNRFKMTAAERVLGSEKIRDINKIRDQLSTKYNKFQTICQMMEKNISQREKLNNWALEYIFLLFDAEFTFYEQKGRYLSKINRYILPKFLKKTRSVQGELMEKTDIQINKTYESGCQSKITSCNPVDKCKVNKGLVL